MQNIKFTNIFELPEEYYPKPADNFIPEWYKDLNSYLNVKKEPDGRGMTSGTAKRCMPIFDAITGGYIIPTYVDVWVKHSHTISGLSRMQ